MRSWPLNVQIPGSQLTLDLAEGRRSQIATGRTTCGVRTSLDWAYETDPQPGCANRRIAQPRGRVLGGSSSMNGMMFWVNDSNLSPLRVGACQAGRWPTTRPLHNLQSRRLPR
jgi:choline dehydrogenase-like flavoprotein